MNDSSDGLNIALLTYLGQPYTGGFGVYVRYLSRALLDRGHRVDVFSGPPYPDLDARVNLIRVPGLELFDGRSPWEVLTAGQVRSWVDLREWLGVVTGGFPLPWAFGRRVRPLLDDRAVEYDVIHDNAGHFPALLQLQEDGCPVVSTVHHPNTIDRRAVLSRTEGWFARLIVRRWFRFTRMQARVIRRLPRLITVSQATKSDILEEYGLESDRVHVAPNGIDTNRFRPLGEVDPEPRRLMAVLSAGWFQATKGFRILAQALHRLVNRGGRDLRLVIVGSSGGEDSGVEYLLMKLDLADRVVFVQDLSTSQMVKFYNRATMVVVPSLYEGFGLPAAEAMACGTPVVASRAGGLPEVVGEAGVLVPPGDPEALADGIRELLEDPERRSTLGKMGRRRVEERFTWPRAAERTEAVYRQVMAGQGRRS